MSEIGETMQIVELAGRGAFIIGKASLSAIQFIMQLYHSKKQREIQLSFGELSLKKLQEKQALTGDQAVFFQVHTQETGQISEIKQELTKRGITFSQLADFDNNDGFTQFYSLAKDSAKLNAFFASHEKLKAGSITLDDYYKTANKKQRQEVREQAIKSVKPDIEKELDAIKEKAMKRPIFLEKEHYLKKEDIEKKYDSLLFKVPEREEEYFMFPSANIEKINGRQSLQLDFDKDYLIIDDRGKEKELVNAAEVYFRYYPLERNLYNNLYTKVIAADQLKMKKVYKEALEKPFARELRLGRNLLLAEHTTSYEFKVPGPSSMQYSVEIPKENVRTLDKGKSYLAVIHLNEAVDAKAEGLPIKMKGHELEELFVASRDLSENTRIMRTIKDVTVR